MKVKNHIVTVAFAVMLLANSAQAGEPCLRFLGCPVPDCIGKWCCDDYRAKCLPCVKVPLCFGCDDYCRKSLPRVCAPLCFTCDDYCKKCQPPVCRPPLLGTLRCVPERASHGCNASSSEHCDQVRVTGKLVHGPLVATVNAANEVISIDSPDKADEPVRDPDVQENPKPVIIELFRR